jgi:Flp pilus assembly protein protease CpaA
MILGQPWTVVAAAAILVVALIASVITDLRSRLILDVVTLPALGGVLLLATIAGGRPALLNAIGGGACLWLPLFLCSLPKRPWIGEGDAKLMAVVGAVAGWPTALVVLFWVSIAGGVQALLAILWARLAGSERPAHVPYGVAIAAGTVGAFLWLGAK